MRNKLLVSDHLLKATIRFIYEYMVLHEKFRG